MLPTKAEEQALPPPPGVIGSLKAGFDAITAHVGLILLPLGLDLLLWLGPRISVNALLRPLLLQMYAGVPASATEPSDFRLIMDEYAAMLERFNLLGALRTLPIGIPSLMSGRMPVLSPLGNPTVLALSSAGQFLGILLVLGIVGWLLGALYFHWVAGMVVTQPFSGSRPPLGRTLLQAVLYSLVWVAILWTIGFPAALIILVTSSINAMLGQAIVLLVGFLALWLLVPLFFSPHGIYLRGQNALTSFVGGFQLTRLTLPTSSLFVLTTFLVWMGLNRLWAVPAEDSWLVMVGLLGHAFISTALLASSFIYYQNMSSWIERMLEHLSSGLPAQKA